MSRLMTDKELVDLMVAAPRAFSVAQPDAPQLNVRTGWALPPPAELILNGVPASHVANEVIVLVEQKRDIEAQRDELLEALEGIVNAYDAPNKSLAHPIVAARKAIARVKGQTFTEMGGVCRCDECGFLWLEGDESGEHTCKGGAA